MSTITMKTPCFRVGCPRSRFTSCAWGRRIDLRFWRDGEATRRQVVAVEGELEVAEHGTAAPAEG